MDAIAAPPKMTARTTEDKIQDVLRGIQGFSYDTPYVVRRQLKKIVDDAAEKGISLNYSDVEKKFVAQFRCESPRWKIVPSLVAREWSLQSV